MSSTISRRELIRKFRKLGFSGPISGGRHQFMIKGTLKIRIPKPHGSSGIGIPLVHEIQRQAGLTRAEWDAA